MFYGLGIKNLLYNIAGSEPPQVYQKVFCNSFAFKVYPNFPDQQPKQDSKRDVENLLFVVFEDAEHGMPVKFIPYNIPYCKTDSRYDDRLYQRGGGF